MARRSKASKPATIALPANCSIHGAQEMKAMLLAGLPEAMVTIDSSGLERIDTAGAQLLVAFAQDRAAKGFGTEWHGCNATLRDAVKVLGLASQIGLPAAVRESCL